MHLAAIAIYIHMYHNNNSTILLIAASSSETPVPTIQSRWEESEGAAASSQRSQSGFSSTAALPELAMKPYTWFGHTIDPSQNPLCFVWYVF
jgi:hypothetical protein